MTAHAKLSASGAVRWLACPPSANFELQFPDKSSSFAEEGTLAHKIAEEKLRQFMMPNSVLTYKDDPLYKEEMEGYTDLYVDYVKSVLLAFKQEPYWAIEQKVDFSDVVPNGFGTADCLIVSGNVLHIVDLKYGKGVEVSAENNPQLRLYAYGAMRFCAPIYEVKKIRMTIFQPRLNNVSKAEISAEELTKWAAETVKPIALQADAGEGEFSPGTHCRFCKAKAVCKARADALMELDPLAEEWNQNRRNPTLAPESNKRPEIFSIPTAEEEFLPF